MTQQHVINYLGMQPFTKSQATCIFQNVSALFQTHVILPWWHCM